jgi:hypothetical protein
MKNSDIVLIALITLGFTLGGGWLVHSLPWVGLLLGLSVGLPISLFIVFIRIGCRAENTPAPLEVEDITGEQYQEDEACPSKECNAIRSLSQGL